MKFLRCLLNLHKLEVFKEEDYKDTRDNTIGKIIINRCADCGKIKVNKIITVKDVY